MLEHFDAWVRLLGVWGYPVLGLAALIEYVFPPFPGDTVTLLGGAYAGRGERSFALVLLAVTAGSMLGIVATWYAGTLVGNRADRLREGTLVFGITHAQLRKVQTAMKERGAWLLVVNRFLPSFRATLFLAAGAAHMPLRQVLLLGTLSALAWNALLLAVGLEVGDNAERIGAFFRTWRLGALAVVAVLAAAWLARRLWRRRRARSRP